MGTQGNEIFGFYYTLAKNLKKSKKSKKEYLETLKRIKKLLEANKKLIQENSEYRRKFINLYQTYMPYLSDVRLDKKYQRLVREK